MTDGISNQGREQTIPIAEEVQNGGIEVSSKFTFVTVIAIGVAVVLVVAAADIAVVIVIVGFVVTFSSEEFPHPQL